MSKLPIYMDNHATTPLDPRVLEAMMPYFKDDFGNPASTDHPYGARAAEAVEHAREQVAKAINAKPHEIIFTSGATEADNLAIQGVAGAASAKPAHIITCTTEHKSVLETCRFLGKSGCRITYTPVDEYGVIDLNRLESSITDRTALISVMFANNEIGTIAPVADIGRIAKKHGVLFHTDAAQAVGHVPVDVEALGIDLMSISAHKAYGPKGIGALYIRGHDPRVRLTPMVSGGGQEKGLRPGTLNVPAIVGMGKAVEIASKEIIEESDRLRTWTEKMRSAFQSIPGSELNGHPSQRLPHNLNMFFKGVQSKALIQSVNSQLAISASSACTTDQVTPSHVILALGFDAERAHCSVRFGLGRFNTADDIDFAIETIRKAALKLRAIKA